MAPLTLEHGYLFSSHPWAGPTGLYMRSELGIPAATSRGRVTVETGWLTRSVRAIPC